MNGDSVGSRQEIRTITSYICGPPVPSSIWNFEEMMEHQLSRTAAYQRVSVRHGIPTIVQTGSIFDGLTLRSSYVVEIQGSFNGLYLPTPQIKAPRYLSISSYINVTTYNQN